MATVMRMPEVIADTTEGLIESWLVAEGGAVEAGAPIAEVETEKAVVEISAELDGVVLRHLVEAGTRTAVGSPIAVIAGKDEGEVDIEAVLAAAGMPSAATEPAPSESPAPPESPAPTEIPASGERLFASPIVRRLAKERALDLTGITGTGPGGRIVRRDLDALPEPVAAPETATINDAFDEIPHSGMRRAIARRLTDSVTTIPQFSLVADCRVDALLDLRAKVNENGGVSVSVNDFIVKAVAGALGDVPEANATWTETAMRRYRHVDISIAVATESGLVTPVIRSADTLSVTAVAAASRELAGRARESTLKQQEIDGGTFSVSNLGMFGVQRFNAIINPPQSAILAVGAATDSIVVVDGAPSVAKVLTVTLTADHRVMDGALAARWLAAFVRRIENPLSILL
ncbi:dihydrolipoamide acetyltransferase family protein [Amycolatopsis sp. NBC_01480]|uniref:dihydrolipoamide acetyltransferase family protein n=1 Tax=Amycolatopsis sp. NBC_01480 TaxID=2903562 RepID=UPI002E2D774E|nr:dihydrolipoamide acetyltransferase family protein [Amycolatopsis sp. NBC_01480]